MAAREEDIRWSNLPNDLLKLILRYVDYTGYYRFCATCISWQNVAPPLRPDPASRDPYHGSPLLLNTKYQINKFFNPLYNVAYETGGVESCDTIPYSSGHGWLLLGVRGGDALFFLDPLTQLRINISDKPSHLAFDRMCFSSPPTSSDCLVVGVSTFCTSARIGVLRCGEESWVVKDVEESSPFFSNPIFRDGRCYCLDNRGRLVVFDPHDVENSWWTSKQFLVPRKYRSKPPEGFLVEGNGEFFSVIVDINHSQRPICVYKLDMCKMMFEKVEDLAHRLIYLSPITSILTTSTIRGKCNKIYFPTVIPGKNEDVVFYSPASKSYYAYGDGLCKNPLPIEEEHKTFSFATWFLPRLPSITKD